MFHKTIVTGALAALILSLFGGGCFWGDPPQEGTNWQPVINGFIVDDQEVTALYAREGEEKRISLVAWDPNGDSLLAENITWETTDGTIVGSGPAVRFVPPPVAWEEPPQEVLVTITVTISDGETAPVSKTLEITMIPPCSDDNRAPTIDSITADPPRIDLGASSKITVQASDADGDTLIYEWTPPFGDIEGTGNEVYWVTDDVCCPDYYDIEVVVSDGCKSEWGFISVWVDV